MTIDSHPSHHHGEHQHGEHQHSHTHEHAPAPGWASRTWHAVSHVLTPHTHDAADKVDAAMEGSREGIRVLWVSLVVLALTAAAQFAIVAWTHSIALLGDSLHNVADALTAIPL